jgi:hypothetical protein
MRIEREFPRIPAWLSAQQSAAAPARLRRFGSEADDLEFDFEAAQAPALIARLLARCSARTDGAPVSEAAMLELPVGLQIEALMALADLSDTLPFFWRFRCRAAQCGAESEFELTADELSSLADRFREDETVSALAAGIQITLRRPTGRDQLEWLEDVAGAPQTMLRRILIAPPLDELERNGIGIDVIEAAVDEAMDEFDPLPGFEMQVVCPECGATTKAAPELTAAALQRLVSAQERLLDDVHTIALNYHWTEAEILAMPVWRRQGYLARIEAVETAS